MLRFRCALSKHKILNCFCNFCSTLRLIIIQQIARNAAIAAENMCLLNAMTRILSSPSDVAKHYDDAHKKARSINCVMRRRELERISIANKHILRGIVSKKPVYDVKALKRDYDDNVATMNRLRTVKDTKRTTNLKDMSVKSVSKGSTVHKQVPLTAAVVIQHNNSKLQHNISHNDNSNDDVAVVTASTPCSEYGGSQFEQDDEQLQLDEHNEYSTNDDFVQVVQSEGGRA
jgi:Hemingway/CFA97